MTPLELQVLRDRVARARLLKASAPPAPVELSPREVAGRKALAALREAERRYGKGSA